MVSYQCEIVKWENKQEVSANYLSKISEHIKVRQPSETTGAYLSFDGELPSRHLIHVRNMVALKAKFSITDLVLVSTGMPCKEREQGGGHAVVTLPDEILHSSVADVIELSNGIVGTSTTALINARVGQGKFRKNVIDIWGNQETCALTGIGTKALLVASHIKPWAQCNSDEERLDGCNGILLAAHVDRLFDSHLITFRKKRSEYRLEAAPSLEKSTLGLLGLQVGDALYSGHLSLQSETDFEKYLAYHNKKFDEFNSYHARD
ncbi:HNH endonuclease [Vibrio europaeus]|uniref:HNH endonuclease n=2 Tax=Vibrio europaeus TaxID=300876 RepID=A0AAE7DXV0_9VIBR|nr:HNH endonuclease [Vibrio europaeus]QPG37869.1 HNH endonuclease [Vibrio europaeus]